ncbi:MAG: sugar phosphate isomerase/epimerase [Verrucomicrobia bacterium]|nr:sugar phosphate isomerase/epimerase [Verrucomicrobiota bacterium]
MHSEFTVSRRQFAKTFSVATAGLAVGLNSFAQSTAPSSKPQIKLGLDNFAVRAMKWNAAQLIDYAATLNTDSLFISDLDAFESLEENHLKELRQNAADRGLQIHVGTWSICPTSKSFRNKHGTAEEHLALGIRVAKALGSPVIRVILGNGEDRKTDGGIEARIADTVKVCKALRNEAMDANVKIAMENHAGDMQAPELVQLIEAAGKEYVGVNMDSGNALWTMEDPLQTLEILGPYVATTSLRDGLIWESENGATVQWTAMGEGMIDWKTYFTRFAELCPGVPVHIETISGFNREIPYLKEDFWSVWPRTKASDFAKFLALAKQGKPKPTHKSANHEAEQTYQKGEIERSIGYCRNILGLGRQS